MDVLAAFAIYCTVGMAAFGPNRARNPVMSRRGGVPNMREYSRLNWDELS